MKSAVLDAGRLLTSENPRPAFRNIAGVEEDELVATDYRGDPPCRHAFLEQLFTAESMRALVWPEAEFRQLLEFFLQKWSYIWMTIDIIHVQ